MQTEHQNGYIVTDVCETVPKKLGPSYLKVSSFEQERLQIAKQLEEKWKFPNCLCYPRIIKPQSTRGTSS